MEALERTVVNNDWLTYILLGAGFILLILNYIDQKRLHQLMALPFNNLYFSNYDSSLDNLVKGFNILLFIFSNLILSILIYFSIQKFYPHSFTNYQYPFITILFSLTGYWFFRFMIGKFIAWIFELSKVQKYAMYVKMNYFFSINFYLLIFVVFGIYFFEWNKMYLKFVLIFYSILLFLRYYHFVISTYKMTFVNLFYFILYLCTLEIAPLLLLYKWGLD